MTTSKSTHEYKLTYRSSNHCLNLLRRLVYDYENRTTINKKIIGKYAIVKIKNMLAIGALTCKKCDKPILLGSTVISTSGSKVFRKIYHKECFIEY